MKLSVIVPCYNEEGNVTDLYEKINNTLSDIKYEVIFVDDGSKDKTLDKLKELHKKDVLHVKIISFSRNYKKEAAMYAGLVNATGKYTCIVDGDLQHNPKYLLDMLNFLEENEDYDEVAMVMHERKNEDGFMKFCKNKFYKIIDKLSEVHFENGASDFRMFNEKVKNAVISLTEKNRFSKGIFSWVGFNIKYLEYDVEPRKSGKSNFNFKNSLNYAIDGILAFSTKPMQIAFKLGLLFMVAFLIYLIVLLVQLLGFGIEWNPIHMVILLILLIAGLQFIVLGIISEYLAKAYLEIKNRPIYIAKEKIGFDKKSIL